MRLVLAIAIFGVAGCGHEYAGASFGLSDERAIAIARTEAARRHIELQGLEAAVDRSETGVMVFFDPPECRRAPCIDGGLPQFFIPSGLRRVTYVRTSY